MTRSWLLGAGAFGAILIAASPALAQRASRPPIRAATIERTLEAGRPVFVANRVIVGSVRFPAHVRAPVTMHGVTVTGRLYASSTAFERLVDLSAARLERGGDFSGASFAGPADFRGMRTGRGETTRFDFAAFSSSALFGGSSFAGAATFADATFNGTSRFRVARFARLADFSSASFADSADFADAVFSDQADFSAAEFHSVADFAASEFSGQASFATARFSQFASFIGATFGVQTNAPVTFATARFDSGATFLDAGFNGLANFSLVESPGDLVFDGSEFDADASFSTARLLGTTSFSQAQIYGLLDFDQAALNKLDLDGAVFETASASVALPQPQASTAHLQELRFDPSAVDHIGVGAGAATVKEREAALSLLGAAALRGGDARAANQAQLERRTMIRAHEWFPLNAADYVVAWGVGGYFVRPWHQVITVLALILFLTLVRIVRWKRQETWKPGGWRTLKQALARSWGAFWKLKIREGTALAQVEATMYTLIVVVFLANLANAWPTGHDLVKGVLP